MNREYIRGFFDIKPIPYHGAFHDWMAGAKARLLWSWIALWHLLFVGIGIIIGGWLI